MAFFEITTTANACPSAICARLSVTLGPANRLRVNTPEAGMFALVDISATGLSGEAFALSLLKDKQVAVMPGESFGAALTGWIRLSLTQSDARIAEACGRILCHATGLQERAA